MVLHFFYKMYSLTVRTGVFCNELFSSNLSGIADLLQSFITAFM